jgi:hypothetical protein
VGVGGPGSALVVAKEGLAAQHSFLRVSRGRVMVEPGAGPALVGGERVRDITPIFPGEELRLGGLLAWLAVVGSPFTWSSVEQYSRDLSVAAAVLQAVVLRRQKQPQAARAGCSQIWHAG